MAKFCDSVGFAGGTVESPPGSGVWIDIIVERRLIGDVVRNTRRLQDSGEKLNNDLTVGNSISVVADAYASQHFHAIRYVKWAGTLWTVSDVEVERPRLLLRLGGVYNGPTPDGSAPAP